MAATFCTQAELRTVLGIGSLYADSVVEEVCQAAENIIKGQLWYNNYYAAAKSLTSNVATLYFQQPHGMYVGQSVIITNAGSPFNGTKTITEINGATQVSALNYQNYSLTAYNYSISYAATGSDQVKNPIQPYATVAAATNVDFATVPEVREATTLIAVDIWQSRQLSNTGGVSPDGFTPSPYRMGNTLLARVRGLIANFLNPNGLVG
jgi:hypothetical protein